jgi:hypothetical protein
MGAPTSYLKCNTCGGVYPSVQGDGTLYFHACPTDKVTTPAVVDAGTGKVTTPEVRTPFANPRDENIVVNPDTGKATMKSAGAGVTPTIAPASS